MTPNWVFGARAKRKQRIDKEIRIKNQSITEIPILDKGELFYMGIMLYWAEGAKQRNTISQGVDFSNSDPRMCKFFLKWLLESLQISDDKINLCIYIHESQIGRVNKVLEYWSKISGFPKNKFGKTCFTRTIYPRKKKRLDKGIYYGQLRIKVRKSTDLNRKIAGWIEGICHRSGVAL